MTELEFIDKLKKKIPELLESDNEFKGRFIKVFKPYFAEKQQTEFNFNKMLEDFRAEMKMMREESARKEAQAREESARKEAQAREESARKEVQAREESEKRFEKAHQESEKRYEKIRKESDERFNRMQEEANKKFDKMLADLHAIHEEDKIERQKLREEDLKERRRFESKIDQRLGAIGERWGVDAEGTFRKALCGILEENFDVKVINVNEYDDEGIVFGRPDQVELDIIIKNGLLIICELKASMSKSDMHIFNRKVHFYEQKHNKKATRKIVISPMIDKRARPVAKELNIECYTIAEEIDKL